jgi:hypothetical protein
LYYIVTREKKEGAIEFFLECFSTKSVELILNGFPVSRRCTRPASVNIGRSVGLRKTIVALGRGGSDDGAKHFEVDHDGHNFAAAARFHQLLVDRLVAPAFKQCIIIVT